MKNTKLFTCLFGSRLYGTSTPTSDLDVKHVVLVDLDELLLGKGVKNSFKKTNTTKNVRNTAEDTDEEFIPVQVFARDFLEGQTYALELAFAMEGTHAEQTFYDVVYNDRVATETPLTNLDPGHYGLTTGDTAYTSKKEFYVPNGVKFMQFTRELRTKFLTSNIKAMMGYVVNQASLYSFKGERLNAVRDVKKILEHLIMETSSDASLETVGNEEFWKELALHHPKYFRKDQYDIGGDRMRPCFYLLEKCLPWTNSLQHSLSVVENLERKYGTRADQASESNVDWKATMHAMRIVDEGLQLLQDRKLEFPFKPGYASYLLKMKRGELPLDPIKQELALKLDALKELERTTTLPSASDLREEFESWLKGWMRKFYGV